MKEILKELKLNESAISMLFGALMVLIIGTLLISNFKNQDNSLTADNTPEQATTEGDMELDTYTVAAGDSLWTIAEREYGTGYEWPEIAAANPSIQSEDNIAIGQEIIIPDTNKILDEAASTTAVAGEETEPEQAERTYTVQSGDNLWDIAVEVYGDGYRWTDIAQANNLVNPDLIHSGNVLSLPA